MEGKKELLGIDPATPGVGSAARAARDGCVLSLHMNNTDNPEVLAVIPLPSAEERRRREIMLTRVMLVAIDLVLSGEGMGRETARDLIREVRHAYPELLDEWNET